MESKKVCHWIAKAWVTKEWFWRASSGFLWLLAKFQNSLQPCLPLLVPSLLLCSLSLLSSNEDPLSVIQNSFPNNFQCSVTFRWGSSHLPASPPGLVPKGSNHPSELQAFLVLPSLMSQPGVSIWYSSRQTITFPTWETVYDGVAGRSRSEVPGSPRMPNSSRLQLPLNVHLAQEPGSLAPTWEAYTEFPAADFSLWLLQAFWGKEGEPAGGSSLSVCLRLPSKF